MPSNAERRELVVDAAGEALRLDAYLAGRLPDLSRSRVTQLLAAGAVRVNGELPKKSQALRPGDRIEILIPAPEPAQHEPEAIALCVLHEDKDLLVIDKPAGMVVHPAPGHRSGTLVNALLHHVGDLSGIGGVQRPGIVHRLDRDTSGLLVVAKHDMAHRNLAAALKRREVRRVYLLAAWGHLQGESLTIDAPVGRSSVLRQRMAVHPSGRRAVTRLRRLERWVAADLLSAELETGRTHQIRVHLLSVGHPVVGDRTYGAGGERGISGPGRGWASELVRRVPRQFLHASELAFAHPRTGSKMHFVSRLPADLAAAAEWARVTS